MQFISISKVGIAHRSVTLCDRGHAILPESVDYTEFGPFHPKFLGGVAYSTAPMFENAKDANAIPKHISLRNAECAK